MKDVPDNGAGAFPLDEQQIYLRLRCLELALQAGQSEPVATAKEFLAFVEGRADA